VETVYYPNSERRYNAMIDVKQAAKTALDYFTEMYKDKYQNITVEEIDFSDDEKYWHITIGYNEPAPFVPTSILYGARNYKIFKIDADAGKVISMKIRMIKRDELLR